MREMKEAYGMKIISGTTEFTNIFPSAVVLGKFDGVHTGHRLLLERLSRAKKEGLYTVVFTFDKSPASLFAKQDGGWRDLCTMEDKREIFAEAGVDLFVEFPMNGTTCKISAESFITDYLRGRLNCKKIIAGEDLSFGYRGLGNKEMLAAYAKEQDFVLELVEKKRLDSLFDAPSGEVISSTLIRQEIEKGNVDRANRMLGSCFHIKGRIIPGNHLGGPVLDMPTINVKWPENIVIPAFGVYYSRVFIGGRMYCGVSNIGRKPTVSNRPEVLAETYIYDFHEDVYGQEARIEFWGFRRPEMRFSGIEALKAQMEKDKEAGRAYWSGAAVQPPKNA